MLGGRDRRHQDRIVKSYAIHSCEAAESATFIGANEAIPLIMRASTYDWREEAYPVGIPSRLLVQSPASTRLGQ
jgi:hypothetical protein